RTASAACRTTGVRMKIVGDGPERAQLEQLAHGGVEFLGRRSDDELRDLYRRAGAVLMPGEEDFGIVPLEAQACGRPVVAYAGGGACETVVQDVTGLLVDQLAPEAFADAIVRALDRRFDSTAIRQHAVRFSRARFSDDRPAL